MTMSLPILSTLWIMVSIIIISLICQTSHPLIVVILLLISNVLMCGLLSFWAPTYIYSMLFALVMISGLLIIFMYFSSLISNERSTNKINYLILMFLPGLMYLLPSLSKIYKLYSPPARAHDFKVMGPVAQEETLLPLIYSQAFSPLTIVSILYLLMTLMSVIKICSPQSSTLRKLMN